jgi:hypothetical protein
MIIVKNGLNFTWAAGISEKPPTHTKTHCLLYDVESRVVNGSGFPFIDIFVEILSKILMLSIRSLSRCEPSPRTKSFRPTRRFSGFYFDPFDSMALSYNARAKRCIH